jgi:hypothetical protein
MSFPMKELRIPESASVLNTLWSVSTSDFHKWSFAITRGLLQTSDKLAQHLPEEAVDEISSPD